MPSQLHKALDAARRENIWDVVDLAFGNIVGVSYEMFIRSHLAMRLRLEYLTQRRGADYLPNIREEAERVERVARFTATTSSSSIMNVRRRYRRPAATGADGDAGGRRLRRVARWASQALSESGVTTGTAPAKLGRLPPWEPMPQFCCVGARDGVLWKCVVGTFESSNVLEAHLRRTPQIRPQMLSEARGATGRTTPTPTCKGRAGVA